MKSKQFLFIVIATLFLLTDANADTALTLPENAVTLDVAGSGGGGADIIFYDAFGSEVLKREVKCVNGGYNSFKGHLSRATEKQVMGNGELFIQVKSGTDIEKWINRFVSQPGRDLNKYKNVTLTVVDDSGKTLYNGGITKTKKK